MRILVCNHGLTQRSCQGRWRRLAELYPDSDVTLLLPDKHCFTDFGRDRTYHCPCEDSGNFHVRSLPVRHVRSIAFFRSRDLLLRELRPDIIYPMYPEYAFFTWQFAFYRRLYAKRAKVVFFTINNWDIYRNNWVQRLGWWYARKATDAAFCHSVEMECVLRRGGYAKPVFIQTNVGVDERMFRRNDGERAEVRARYGLDGFTVGYCGRLEAHKALDELVQAIALVQARIRRKLILFIVGDGPGRDELLRLAAELNVAVHITGALEFEAVPPHYSAMDLFVLPSKTTPSFKEPFGLTLAQAMATQVPVIASSSGAKPEVVGDAGLIYPSGFPGALSRCIERLVENDELRMQYALAGYERCMRLFSATALSHDFYAQAKCLLAQA